MFNNQNLLWFTMVAPNAAAPAGGVKKPPIKKLKICSVKLNIFLIFPQIIFFIGF